MVNRNRRDRDDGAERLIESLAGAEKSALEAVGPVDLSRTNRLPASMKGDTRRYRDIRAWVTWAQSPSLPQ